MLLIVFLCSSDLTAIIRVYKVGHFRMIFFGIATHYFDSF